MTFPQPAGYYGLQLSPEAEAEITSLDFNSLALLTHELTFKLITLRGSICTIFSTQELDDELNKLSTSEVVAAIRWFSDRLAFLHTVPVQEVAK